jgi:hypothetical protein
MDAGPVPATRRRPRRAFVVVLAVAVALGVVVPVGRFALEVRDQTALDRVVAVAAALRDPDGLTPVREGCALRGAGTVRCAVGRSARVISVREVAGATQRALSAAAGRPATVECWDLGRPAKATTSCLVQVREGRHAASVWVDTEASGSGGPAGVEYVVQVA